MVKRMLFFPILYLSNVSLSIMIASFFPAKQSSRDLFKVSKGEYAIQAWRTIGGNYVSKVLHDFHMKIMVTVGDSECTS